MAEVLVPDLDGEQVTLVELVNRVVDRGVMLHGEITISVADVDLLFLGLRVLLCSADRLTPPAGPPLGAAQPPHADGLP